jgi:hypothetical protein
MQILVDHNLEGDADQLSALLSKEGWAELLGLEFVCFADVALDVESDDTTVWRFAQAHGMLILTLNRNNEGETSLTATIRRENTPSSLPVITVASQNCLKEQSCRQAAALRLAEIVTYLERYLGTGRLYIP